MYLLIGRSINLYVNQRRSYNHEYSKKSKSNTSCQICMEKVFNRSNQIEVFKKEE